MEENYCLIKEIIKKSYTIGTYQRGYRWDEDNVKELLDDIFEGKLFKDFNLDTKKYSNSFTAIFDLKRIREGNIEEYCLQPLVIKKVDENYNVIDGQQRLTTIYIILKVLSKICDRFVFPETFSIQYRSKEKTTEFLQNILEKEEPIDIDSSYMLKALETIEEWFLEKNLELKKIIRRL